MLQLAQVVVFFALLVAIHEADRDAPMLPAVVIAFGLTSGAFALGIHIHLAIRRKRWHRQQAAHRAGR